MTHPRILADSHIVMVDDNPADRFFAEKCFERSKVTNPWLSLSGGPDLLAHLAEVKAGRQPMPAIVLLDINMPKMNGLEVLEAVRADPSFTELPIFCMLTSSTDPRDREVASSLGASGFVTKPDHPAAYIAFFDSLLPE